jgi:hypothetical protein
MRKKRQERINVSTEKPVCCLNILPKNSFISLVRETSLFPIKMRCETIRSNVLEVFSCYTRNDHLRILLCLDFAMKLKANANSELEENKDREEERLRLRTIVRFK